MHVWLPDIPSDDSPVVFAREEDAEAYVAACAHRDKRWAAEHAPLLCLVHVGADAAEMIRAAGGSDEAVEAAMTAPPSTDGNGRALDAIAAVMSGQEWDADTMDAVANLVRSTGRVIADVDEDDVMVDDVS